MIKRLKLAGFSAAVIAVSGVVIMGVQAYELKTNYLLVDARVTSVTTKCFIAERNGDRMASGTREPAYLECGLAEIVAKQHGFKESAVRKRVTVTYEYRSPADGRLYTADFVRTSEIAGLEKGVTMRVHAHKSNPQETKTTRLNLFLADTGA